MEIFIFILSVLIITGLAWLANKVLPFKVCPICLGVSGTWIWILAGISSGQLPAESWQLIASMALGGTVVGIAYQGEKRFDWAKQNIFRFRVPVMILGFPLAYWAVTHIGWGSLVVLLAILAPVFYLYFIAPRGNKFQEKIQGGNGAGKVAELEEKLKSCCD